MEQLTEVELQAVKDCGIKKISYTDEGITEKTVSREIMADCRQTIIRCNYLDDETIEIVEIKRWEFDDKCF